MSETSILEKLQASNDKLEIWWDSSPLAFKNWSKQILSAAPDEIKRKIWKRQLERFLDAGNSGSSFVRGVTTNPSLIAKVVLEEADFWSREIRETIHRQSLPDIESTFWLIYQKAVGKAAAAMMPKWEASQGRYGWVSGQLDPRFAFDTDRMMEQALQISRLSPNLMIKVPGSRQGYEVIKRLVSRGISINNTFSYTIPQFMQCIRAVENGLKEACRMGIDTSRWRAVVTYMIGRFGSQGDLLEEAAERKIPLSYLDIRWAELAIIKRIYSIIQKNAYPVKMLLSSLQVDDPKKGADTLSMHLEQTAGADIAYTCKPQFIEEIMYREAELKGFNPEAIYSEVPAQVLDKLNKLPYFAKAYEPDGMKADEFACHGAFLNTYLEVNRNHRRLIDFVAHQFQSFSGLNGQPYNQFITAQTAA